MTGPHFPVAAASSESPLTAQDRESIERAARIRRTLTLRLVVGVAIVLLLLFAPLTARWFDEMKCRANRDTGYGNLEVLYTAEQAYRAENGGFAKPDGPIGCGQSDRMGFTARGFRVCADWEFRVAEAGKDSFTAIAWWKTRGVVHLIDQNRKVTELVGCSR